VNHSHLSSGAYLSIPLTFALQIRVDLTGIGLLVWQFCKRWAMKLPSDIP